MSVHEDQPSRPVLESIEYPKISDLVPDVADYPAEIPVDTAEEVTTVLYEFVGHLGADVGQQGYEFRLVQRAGRLARELQASIITSVRRTDEVARARRQHDHDKG